MYFLHLRNVIIFFLIWHYFADAGRWFSHFWGKGEMKYFLIFDSFFSFFSFSFSFFSFSLFLIQYPAFLYSSSLDFLTLWSPLNKSSIRRVPLSCEIVSQSQFLREYNTCRESTDLAVWKAFYSRATLKKEEKHHFVWNKNNIRLSVWGNLKSYFQAENSATQVDRLFSKDDDEENKKTKNKKILLVFKKTVS